MSFQIGGREIGGHHPPFIIAEMSGNHNQSIDRALELVDAAAAAGAHALKLQTYTADTITLNVRSNDFLINDKSNLWNGENLYDLYSKAHTPWEWHKEIMDRANRMGMICFSSPFDESAVDFLEELNVPAYKIASFENNHIPLIKKAASTGKPLIISTGMASLGEIESSVKAARDVGCTKIVLLKCTSTYPASPMNTNIRTIPHLRQLFNTEVGLSDHSMGLGVALASVALGASVIEKHLTLSRADGGVDSAFSLEPNELEALVVESERAWQALGKISYGPTEAERASIKYRRSIYVAEDISEGEIFTKQNIRIVRPGGGASPDLYDAFLGKVATCSLTAGTPLNIESLFKMK